MFFSKHDNDEVTDQYNRRHTDMYKKDKLERSSVPKMKLMSAPNPAKREAVQGILEQSDKNCEYIRMRREGNRMRNNPEALGNFFYYKFFTER